MLEDVLPCNTTLTVNTSSVKAASFSKSRGTLNPGSCTYQTPLTTMEIQAPIVVNSIKLQLTAYSLLIRKEWKQCYETELFAVCMRYCVNLTGPISFN